MTARSLGLRLGLTAVVVGLASCHRDEPIAVAAADRARLAAAPGAVDAFDWFKDPFGGPKRFGRLSTVEGLALAYDLQGKGARRVLAVGIERHTGPDSHQSARALLVELPADPERRRSLFRLAAEQTRAAGFRAEADTGQDYLYLPGAF